MPKDLCVVCGSRSNTFSFGVFCCRACCAFFRRSLNKKYTCRRENNCKIDQDGMRNACRACRLARCYKAGMSVESENKQSTSSDQKPQMSYSVSSSEYFTSTPPLSIYSSPSSQLANGNFQEPDPARFPFIHKVLNDFLTLQRSQKSLYSIENPHTIFADTEFQQINKVFDSQLIVRDFGLLRSFGE
ncbi:Nuclear receptor domain-containing protein [Aphelenchoides bicaudatus]|nr:Nuclear receptor domain-containing protein [Aphelenchoides bicaudatus]